MSISSIGGSSYVPAFNNGQQAPKAAAPLDFLQSFATQLYKAMDANGDGTVTKSEMSQSLSAAGKDTPFAITPQQAGAVFDKLDLGHSGKVDGAQFVAGVTAVFNPHVGRLG